MSMSSSLVQYAFFVAISLVSTFSFASQTKEINETNASEAPPRQTINMSSNQLLHAVTFQGEGVDIKMVVQDGRHSSFSVDSAPSIKFIAKTNESTGEVEIWPIGQKTFQKNGKEHVGPVILNSLASGEVSDEMKAIGITSINVAGSVSLQQWKAQKQATASGLACRPTTTSALTRQLFGMRKVDAEGEKCCSAPCTDGSGRTLTFCTTGSSGCGGDGICGAQCCV
jgi:hypothetical protein